MARRPTVYEHNSLLNPISPQFTPSLHTRPKEVEALPGIGSTIMRTTIPDHKGAIAAHYKALEQAQSSNCSVEIQNLSRCFNDAQHVGHCQTFSDKLKSCKQNITL